MIKAIKSIMAVWILVSAGLTGLFIFIPEEGMKVSAATITVDDSGGAHYLTIQEGIDAADDGDTVSVKSGTYYEGISIDKTITLKGEDRETTVIVGGGTFWAVDINANWVNVSGFTITDGDDGLHIRSQYNSISDNNISSNSEDGIYISSANNIITGNDISSNSDAGIYLSGSDGNTIEDNNIWNNDDGIFLFECENNNIIGNDIRNNECGIYHASQSENHVIHHNIFIENGVYDGFTSQWDDGQEGNYWDGYRGEDANGDGIGDTPYYDGYYTPRDNYPLMLSMADFKDPIAVVNAGQEIDFGSYDETRDHGTIFKKSWDFDASNGIQEDAVGEAPKHTYHASGIYTATLTVTIEGGTTIPDNLTVCVADEHLVSLDDGTGDIMNEDEVEQGEDDEFDTDMTTINLWEVGDFLLFQMSVKGTIHEDIQSGDAYVYGLNIFMDGSDNIKNVDDSEFAVFCGMGETEIENKDTGDTLSLEAHGFGTSTLWIFIPLSFIGDTTDFEINAYAMVFKGFSRSDGSYEEAYIDWSADADEGEVFQIILILISVLVVGIIIAVFLIRRKKSSQEEATAELDMQEQQYDDQQPFLQEPPPQPQQQIQDQQPLQFTQEPIIPQPIPQPSVQEPQSTQPEAIVYNCPHCGKPFSMQQSAQVQQISCPSCMGQVTIDPQPPQAATPEPSPQQSPQPPEQQPQEPSWETQQQPQEPTLFQLDEPTSQPEADVEGPVDTLKTRLAKGEIDLDTYHELKKEIESGTVTGEEAAVGPGGHSNEELQEMENKELVRIARNSGIKTVLSNPQIITLILNSQKGVSEDSEDYYSEKELDKMERVDMLKIARGRDIKITKTKDTIIKEILAKQEEY